MKMLRYDPFLHPPLAPPCLTQSHIPHSAVATSTQLIIAAAIITPRRDESSTAAPIRVAHPRASRPNPCTHAHPRPRGPYTTTQPETPTCLRILLGMPNAASWHSSQVINCTSQSSAHRRLNPRARAPSTSPGCPHSLPGTSPISKQITTPPSRVSST